MSEQLGKTDEWDPVEKRGDPTLSKLVRDYVRRVTGEQRREVILVRQTPPMMSPELMKLVGAMRARALVTPTILERLIITRDVALFVWRYTQ